MEVASLTYRLHDHINLEVLIDSVDRRGRVDDSKSRNAFPWSPQLPTLLERHDKTRERLHTDTRELRIR
jgi:hypothetical protein